MTRTTKKENDKEEVVPVEETNDSNDTVTARIPNAIPNDGQGTPPTGDELIKPKGQQTIDQGAGAIVKKDNVPVDRANVEAPLDLTNTEQFGNSEQSDYTRER